MGRSTRITLTLLGILGFVALLFYGALSQSQVSCEVCVEYAGQRNCQTSRGESPDLAMQGAHSAACANLTSGVTNAFRCGQTRPYSSRCATE